MRTPLSALRLGPPSYLYTIWGYDKDAESELEKLKMSLVVQEGKEGALNVCFYVV